jgi:hypothetical protein
VKVLLAMTNIILLGISDMITVLFTVILKALFAKELVLVTILETTIFFVKVIALDTVTTLETAIENILLIDLTNDTPLFTANSIMRPSLPTIVVVVVDTMVILRIIVRT